MSNRDSKGLKPTNEQVVAEAISSLENDDNTDIALLNVISEHIARLNPKESAVSDALGDIEALAEKRSEESDAGPADHD
jgi:hypothetical protein